MTTPTDDLPTTPPSRGAGPLTTVFTMPDFCHTPWWTFPATPAVSSSVCMPGNWVDYYGNRSGFYSPGICPQGYTEGCYLPTSAARFSADGKPWNGGPILAGETARICCPAGYQCYEDLTTDNAVRWRKCITTAANPLTTLTRIIDGTTTATTTTPALAFGIQVRWQSSDLSILETDPTVPGATYTGKPHRPGEGDGNGSSNSGPSTAIIVVGVVVPVMSLILGIIAFLYWRHHYRAKYKRTGGNASSMDLTGSDGEQDEENSKDESAIGLSRPPRTAATSTTAASSAGVVHEADPDAQPWMELPAEPVPIQELPDTAFVAELADTSIQPLPHRRQTSLSTANDLEGSTARRKSQRISTARKSNN
ncbi:hypothetical protein PG989_005961 [Apiospora arundinis]|uniref:Uncharacterized protein n=1 Tax=Apiospora arundinis TaxID=335852 RepID=A0ABR2IVC7_9PEZI